MKKSIFLIFAAILCSVSAWAYNYGGSNVYYYFANTGSWPGVHLYIWNGGWNQDFTLTKIANTNVYYHKWSSAYNNNEGILFRGAANWNNGQTSDIKANYTNHTSWVHNSTTGKTDLSNINRSAQVAVKLSTGGNYTQTANANCVAKVSGYTVEKGKSSATAKNASTSGSSATASISAAYGSTITYTATDGTGYTFKGFSTNNSTSLPASLSASGKTATASGYGSTNNSTYYAYFKANQYTVKFDANGGTGSMSDQSYTYSVSQALTANAFTRTGYTFEGWNTKADGTGTSYTDKQSVSNLSSTDGESVTLYAQWAEIPANNHNITYTAQATGWTYGAQPTSAAEGATVTFEVIPTTGYTVTVTSSDVSLSNNGNTYTFTMPTTDVAIDVTATENSHDVTISYKCGDQTIQANGTATAVGEITAKEITAPEITGYKFTSWTLGNGITNKSANTTTNPINITTKASGTYTLTVNYEKVVTVYFVNSSKWTAVNCHHWVSKDNTAGTTWPGDKLTKTGETVNEFDVYKATFTNAHTMCIFNNNGAGQQTGDLEVQDGKYYYPLKNQWYASLNDVPAIDPLATDVYLAGDMTNKDNWDVNKKEFKKATAEATTASVTVTLAAQTYKFKLVVGGAWKGNTGTMKRGGESVHEGGWQFDKDGYDDNCQIVADIAGDYTFTWNLTDKKLTVAYPPLPKHQVTATVNPAETGEVTGTGEYEQGSKATLVATPAAGYAFKNWTVGGTEKSTEATYTFTVNEPISLVANFIPEVTHEVTVSYLCNDTPIPGQAETKLAVGVTTPSTITAPAITNYKFDSWTLGTGVQSEDDSKNPISITSKSTGEYTLAANYTKIELTYNVTVPAGTEKCYIAGEMNSWAFQEMTKIDETHYTITIEGAEKTHKYKYTCGEGWDYVEKKADGSDIGDRTWKANDVVAKWGKPDTYTIAGTPATVFGKEWDATYTANDMKLQEDGTFVWSVTGLELTKTTNVAFKIVKNQNWETAWPAENKTIPVTEDGTYNLTIYFNAAEKDDATKNNGIYISFEKQAVVTPETYTRTVTAGHYGTICLPYASSSYSGAEFYEVSWLKKSGETPVNLYLNQLAAGTQLEAGKPYIFRATSTELTVTYTGAPVDAPIPADENNGLTGSFDAISAGGVLTGNYVVAQNKFWTATATAYADENRAYIDKEKVPYTEQKQIPGRRRVSLGAAGENAETGIDNIITTDTPVKVIENGQLIIIRNGEKFNVQGQKL